MCTRDTAARVRRGYGQEKRVSPLVQVSEPGPGNTIKLTVVRPGETTVEITSEGITKELPLHAKSYGGTILVAMAQE